MKIVLKFLKNTYKNVLHSIAFYPVLITLVFLFIAFGGLEVENFEPIQELKKNLPYFFIQDYETARSILSTLIGGILSLTVFSFTMVMSVLSQASSNFSPRLLPDLISNKKHQIILGVYIGTLSYCIIILISLGASGVDSSSLGLSTMFAALLGVICIGLFVYFIHNISRAIQIQNIVDSISDASSNYLMKKLEIQKKTKDGLKTIDTTGWTVIKSNKSGYFRGFDPALLLDSLKEEHHDIFIIPYLNQHIWKGAPLLKIKKQVDEEQKENLDFCVTLSPDRLEGEKGIGGMIKLMEIAVKAMSPGINDPGTAIDAILKLTQLLRLLLQLPQISVEKFYDRKLTVIEKIIDADEAMRLLIQPIRQYSKQDSAVCYVLIEALQFINQEPDISQDKKAVIEAELAALKRDIEDSIENETDKQRVIRLFDKSGLTEHY
ncbi:DUF2254 domain-containing protein [Flavimarina sp. Hel_I_48]|uniref:DUF2254 domain-containing protein n=1 Tax=Flavimarina sp. Hel_I_48 TaxID=1392488 RepID=UPI0004DF6587|nr:DUF2254 domain-containing protein [Flavimarina sp. Hel_I_48]